MRGLMVRTLDTWRVGFLVSSKIVGVVGCVGCVGCMMIVALQIKALCEASWNGTPVFLWMASAFEVVYKCYSDLHKVVHIAILLVEMLAKVTQYCTLQDSCCVCSWSGWDIDVEEWVHVVCWKFWGRFWDSCWSRWLDQGRWFCSQDLCSLSNIVYQSCLLWRWKGPTFCHQLLPPVRFQVHCQWNASGLLLGQGHKFLIERPLPHTNVADSVHQ